MLSTGPWFSLDSARQSQGEARGAGGSQTRVAGADEGQQHLHAAELPDQLPQPGGRGGAAGGAAPDAAVPGGLPGWHHADTQGEGHGWLWEGEGSGFLTQAIRP